jgi:hypothetical protein
MRADCRKRGCPQVGKDLVDQRGVVAAPGPAQQRHQPGPSQLLPGCRGRDGGQHGRRGAVFEVRKRLQRLRIEFQQHRTQAVDGVLQRPDRLLVLAGQRLDCAGLAADRWQRAVQVPVSTQDVREYRGVAGIGFAAGLAVAFPIAGHRARVDRIHGEPGLGQGHNEQVLVGFQRDRSVLGASAVFGDQRQ